MDDHVSARLDRMNDNRMTAEEQERRRQEELMTAMHEKEKDYSFFTESVTDMSRRLQLQEFFRRATKYYHYIGRASEFERARKGTLIKLLLFFAVGAVTAVVTSCSFGLYSPLTLLENIWLLLILFSALHVYRAQYVYEHTAMAASSIYCFEIDGDLLYCPTQRKRPYRICRVLAPVSAALNIVVGLLLYDFLAMLPMLVCESLFIVSALLMLPTVELFFDGYGPIYYGGYLEPEGEYTVLVYDRVENTVRTKAQFEEQFPFMKE